MGASISSLCCSCCCCCPWNRHKYERKHGNLRHQDPALEQKPLLKDLTRVRQAF